MFNRPKKPKRINDWLFEDLGRIPEDLRGWDLFGEWHKDSSWEILGYKVREEFADSTPGVQYCLQQIEPADGEDKAERRRQIEYLYNLVSVRRQADLDYRANNHKTDEEIFDSAEAAVEACRPLYMEEVDDMLKLVLRMEYEKWYLKKQGRTTDDYEYWELKPL